MLEKLAKNSFIYTVTNVLQKGIAFLLLPVYTKYLSPEDYGVLAVVTALIGFFLLLYTLGLNAAVTRFYFEYKDKPEKLREFWGTVISLILLVSVISCIALITFGKILIEPYLGDVKFWPYVAIGIFSTVFMPFYEIFLTILQTKQKPKQYAIFSLINFTINLTLTLTFIIYLGYDAEGPLLASLYTFIIFFFVALYYLRNDYVICIKREHAKKALKYSLPLIPHILSGHAMVATDKLLLTNIMGIASTGIYNIGFMIGGIMSLITGSINRAYVPIYMNTLTGNNKEDIKKLKNAALIIIAFYCLIASAISMFSIELVTLFTTESFHDGYKVVPIFAYSFLLTGVYYIFVNILFFDKKATKYVSISTFIGVTINILLNIMFIPRYGITGAAFATLISQLVITIIAAYIGKKYERIRWNYMRITLAVLLSFVTSYYISDRFNEISINNILIKISLIFILVGIIGNAIWNDTLYLFKGFITYYGDIRDYFSRLNKQK